MYTRPAFNFIAIHRSENPPFGKQRVYAEELHTIAHDNGIEVGFVAFAHDRVLRMQGYRLENGVWERCDVHNTGVCYDRLFSSSKSIALEMLRKSGGDANLSVFNSADVQATTSDKSGFSSLMHRSGINSVPHFGASELIAKEVSVDNGWYVKPRHGFGGTNIIVTEGLDEAIRLVDESYRANSTDIISTTGSEETKTFKTEFVASPRIIQPTKKNQACDIRVLVQRSSTDAPFKITGAYIRVGTPNASTSNVSGGGKVVPIEMFSEVFNLTSGRSIDAVIDEVFQLCIDATVAMEQFYLFCEVAFDILIREDFQPTVLEANSKPARWGFALIAADKSFDNKLRKKYLETRRHSIENVVRFGNSVVSS